MEMGLALRGVAPISLLCHPCCEVPAQPLNRGGVSRLVGEVGQLPGIGLQIVELRRRSAKIAGHLCAGEGISCRGLLLPRVKRLATDGAPRKLCVRFEVHDQLVATVADGAGAVGLGAAVDPPAGMFGEDHLSEGLALSIQHVEETSAVKPPCPMGIGAAGVDGGRIGPRGCQERRRDVDVLHECPVFRSG